MCCYNDPKLVKKLQTEFKKEKYIKVYKAVKLVENGLDGVVTPYKSYPVGAGWAISNTKARKAYTTMREVDLGIHVYLKPIAKDWFDTWERSLTCYALLNDLIAAQDADLLGKRNIHAVFKKIYVPKKNLQKLTSNFVVGNLENNPCA